MTLRLHFYDTTQPRRLRRLSIFSSAVAFNLESFRSRTITAPVCQWVRPHTESFAITPPSRADIANN